MNLLIQTGAQMLAAASAAAQAACAQLLDLSVGSPARAILRATSSLWEVQQANVYRLLKASRLSTSTGDDVDTFVGDYGLVRDPATSATGVVTLSRFTPLSPTTVVVGATVRTGDGAYLYSVTADPASAYWSADAGTAGGYILPVGTESIAVPVTAVVPGTSGNVIAGAISLTGDDMSGIDYVGNAAAITGGADAESDAALKVRFVGYVASLTKSTVAAVVAAVGSVQAGISCTLRENSDEAGHWRPGHFVLVVDDGTGAPSPSLLAAVYSAVDLVRPIGSTFSTQPPTVVRVGVALVITVGTGGIKANLLSPVQAAVQTYVDTLPTGTLLSVSRIAAAAYGVDASITNVSAIVVTLPDGSTTTSDLPVAVGSVAKFSTVTVT